ncbi:MAG: B12-binding domain-containing radical SAM protein [Candidatus Omnitrophica bacterium]|nr:B12-binding domain-containing radical SAM protein [Candidatus Omnitrophota bacterium]
MRVLFLYPNLHGMNMLPPSIGLFSSILKMHNHTVELFDSTNWVIPGEESFDSDKVKEKLLNARPFDDSILRSEMHQGNVFNDFEKKIRTFGPDLIAVSVTEDIFLVGISLLKSIRHLKIPTIMGGVFPTFTPTFCLSYDEVDMICVGEGEDALVELCDRMEKGLAYDNIANIWVKKEGVIKRNPLRSLRNLDENPLLDFSLFEESRFYRPMQGKVWKMLPVETHRGCPYQCTYCNSPSQYKLYREETGSSYFRKKSFDILEKEIIHFRDAYKAEAFYFWADTFMTYTDREFDQFVELYSGIKLPFWCQVFPDLIDEKRIKKLMRIGLFRIGTGIEHGNEEFRRNVLKRRASNALMLEKFKILEKCEIRFSVNNIIGFPTETRALAMDTVEVNSHINADSVNAYSFSPFHGTPLRKMAEELGYCKPDLIARSATKKSLLNMPQFPPEAIEGLRRCFVLYVKMPKNRWKDIEKAERLTSEGNRIWAQLRNECADKYMDF